MPCRLQQPWPYADHLVLVCSERDRRRTRLRIVRLALGHQTQEASRPIAAFSMSLTALDGRRARQAAWAPADAQGDADASRAGELGPPRPFPRAFLAAGAPPAPAASLFPRAAFPQDDGPRRAKSAAATVAADNLLSLIHSTRENELRASVGEAQRRREDEEDASDHTSDEQAAFDAAGRIQPRKKRPAAVMERGDDSASKMDAAPKRRYKKPTYIVRREKKEVLEEELRVLSQKLVQLRRESGIPDWFFEQKELLVEKSQENVRLREAMHQHDMYLANANRIMLAEYMAIHSESPIKTFIHLTSDLKLRRKTLVDLKDIKLEQANKFIMESSKCLHPTKHWCQESKYEADNGDFCAIKMDNTPFHGVKSVRQVFDALQFFFRNMEISISEMLGDITVREDDDQPDNSLSNHRLVSVMSHGVKVEKNIVKFFKYVEPEDDSPPYALVATDAVDIDEMYPYIPEERLRMDINAAMKFTEHFVKKPKKRQSSKDVENRGLRDDQESEDGEEEYERVVVLTRFFRAKLHNSEMDIPAHVLQEIRQGLACFTDTMVKTMHRIIYETKRTPF